MSTATAEKIEAPANEPPTLAEQRAAWAVVYGEKSQRAAALVAAQRAVDEYTQTFRRPPPSDLERAVSQARGRLGECERCRTQLMDSSSPQLRAEFRALATTRLKLTERIAKREPAVTDFKRRVVKSIEGCKRRQTDAHATPESVDLDTRTIRAMEREVADEENELKSLKEALASINEQVENTRMAMLRP
jgi:chromosome segregation ATPase